VYLLKRLTRILAVVIATCVGTHSAVAQTSTTPLELRVLGSGGPGAVGRAASCYLVLAAFAQRLRRGVGIVTIQHIHKI
jgi:hypothetical protein